MINWNNLDTLTSFKELSEVERVNLAEVMSGANGAERVKDYSVPMTEDLTYNYAAKAVDDKVLAALAKLAKEAQLTEKYAALYNGEVINTGEKRLVLHHMTRGQLGNAVEADGADKRAFYTEQQKRIAEFADLKEALLKRMEFFAQMGCSVSDHALEYVMYAPAAEEKVDEILKKRLNGESISREEEMIFKTAFMQFVGKEYHKKNWVMQIHYGCKRDNNAFMYEQLGPDTGYDCINNYAPSAQTADFLNSLIASNELPKTILYSLNPNDNEAIGTILGCFQGTEAAGKIQQGSAWWFNDHKTGMIAQMTSLANLGLLANFVGMLTDSRSFLSYTRHEYFRRILCELIGGWVENGEYPADYKTLKEIVCGISYNNAVDYFGFDL